MKIEFSRSIFEKHFNIKFHKHLSSGGPVVPHRQTDMTKLIVAFPNFANATLKGSEVNDCEDFQIVIWFCLAK
jgi:hypothetical protein